MSASEETIVATKELQRDDAVRAELPRRSLRKGFSWALVGNVVFAGCQWGMLMALVKLGTPEMVGQFGLGLAITSPIMLFATLSLRPVEATDAKREYRFGEYLGLTCLTSSLAMLVIGGIVLVGTYSWETGWVIVAIGFRKTLLNLSDVYYGLFQQNERMDLITQGTVLNGLLSLFALGTGVYVTGSVLWGVVAATAASGITLATYNCFHGRRMVRARPQLGAVEAPSGRFTGTRFATAKRLSKLAWIALPLGCAAMLISLDTNIPRYFVVKYLGERELGIFVALAYVIVAGRMGVSAFAQTCLPRLSKHHANSDVAAFTRLMRRLLLFSVILSAAAVAVVLPASRELLTLLYRPEYAEHTDVFFWLTLTMALSFVGCFLDCGISAARGFRSKLAVHCAMVATTTVAAILIVPSYGLLGAALAMFLSRFVQLALKGVVLVRFIGRMRPLPT